MIKPSFTIIFEDDNRKEFQEELQVLIKKHNGIITRYKTIKNEEDTHGKESKFNEAKTSLSSTEHPITYTYRKD